MSEHVVVLFDKIGPYHHARLTAAGKRLPLTVIELARKSREYNWAPIEDTTTYRRQTLFSDQATAALRPQLICDRVTQALDELRPTTLAIPGWSEPGPLSALYWALLYKVPAIVMSATSAQDFRRRWIKEWIKRRVVSSFCAALVGGEPHRTYVNNLGVASDTVFVGYNVVDNAHFREGSQAARKHTATLRRKYELPARYLLVCARFVPKKNLPRLVQAFSCYRANSVAPGLELVLVGDGPERVAIEEAIERSGLEHVVHLVGFRSYDELPVFYGLADALIHASTTEQWGLVVNEAMASGLPVLVSDACGCTQDLVHEEQNGFTFDPYDVQAMANLMHMVATQPQRAAAMGTASSEIIQQWSPGTFARGLKSAVDVCTSRAQTHSILDRMLVKALIHR